MKKMRILCLIMILLISLTGCTSRNEFSYMHVNSQYEKIEKDPEDNISPEDLHYSIILFVRGIMVDSDEKFTLVDTNNKDKSITCYFLRGLPIDNFKEKYHDGDEVRISGPVLAYDEEDTTQLNAYYILVEGYE